jgi:molecular chaperone GrpE
VTNLLAGIRMVVQQLADTLKANAAQLIDAEGQSFDPNLHEALSQVPTPDHPPMTVIQVVESGYVMHDRVVRPAKVIVSSAPPEPATEVEPTEE